MKLANILHASILHEGRATVGIIGPGRSVFWTLADIIPGLPPRIATDGPIAGIGTIRNEVRRKTLEQQGSARHAAASAS